MEILSYAFFRSIWRTKESMVFHSDFHQFAFFDIVAFVQKRFAIFGRNASEEKIIYPRVYKKEAAIVR